MFEPPAWSRLTHGATETYSHIDSLDQISRARGAPFEHGYPAQGTPNWWALRKRYEELLFARIRKQRAASTIQLPLNEAESVAAKWAALGNEEADREYQRFALR